jgi:hypothetical protein
MLRAMSTISREAPRVEEMKWYIVFESDVPAVAMPAILAMIDRGSISNKSVDKLYIKQCQQWNVNDVHSKQPE